MSGKLKVGLVQSLAGAIILTLLMMPMGMLGFGQYIWMLFLPLLLFFAMGAQFKLIPSMIVCYICGVVWAYISGLLQSAFGAFAPQIVVETVPTIITIFLILTIHENLLANTTFGNIPSLFLGMCSTFFVFTMNIDITPFHLIGFYIYGIVLVAVLVLGGGAVCNLAFGKENVQKICADGENHD